MLFTFCKHNTLSALFPCGSRVVPWVHLHKKHAAETEISGISLILHFIIKVPLVTATVIPVKTHHLDVNRCVCVCVRMSPPSCHHSLRSYLLPSVCHQSSLQVCAIMLWLLRCWETFTLKPAQAENILKVSALNLIHYKCMSNQKNFFFFFFGLICHAPLKIYL